MYKYIVVARRPQKRTLLWNYPDNYFPRRVFYKRDADSLATSAKAKGGEGVSIEPYTIDRYAAAIRRSSSQIHPGT